MLRFLKKHAILASVTASLLLTGCDQNKDEAVDLNKLKIGVIAGAEEQVAEIAAKVAKEKYGLDVEMVIFTDYVSPNAALAEGAIDVNAFQHKPYLDQQIKDRNYPFEIAGTTLLYPIAAYSNKIKSIDQIQNGDQIAVPNDPTNLGRSLLLLEQQGLIEVDDKAGLKATLLDITKNPKNLNIIELEAPQLPRSLDDVTLAIINNTYASSIPLTPEKDGLFVEDKASPYVNLIVARRENVNAQNVQNFVKAYQTQTVFDAANEIFKGGAIKGW